MLSRGVPPPGIGGFSNYTNVSWVSVAKFAEETAKTSSDVIGYGMVSCAVMAYADEMYLDLERHSSALALMAQVPRKAQQSHVIHTC